MTDIIPVGVIERRIYQLRGQRVMLDADLAELYQVETGALTRAVKRNLERFPSDFMFQLTDSEWETLRCQTGISNEDSSTGGRTSKGRGGRRYLPYVFTEQGVAMLSSVLRSDRAIQVNIGIMRAFSRLRKVLSANADLAKRVEALEQQLQDHKGAVGQQLGTVQGSVDSMLAMIEVIRDWMVGVEGPEPPQREYGFRTDEQGEGSPS